MNDTLQNILNNYRAGLLSTPNIQMTEKKFCDEVIQFSDKIMVDHSFISSSFSNSNFFNMKFINISFASSYFKNCIFENTIFKIAEFDNSVFKNCQFIHCNLNEIDATETIFNECTFLKSSFDNAIFESCHFLKPIFEDVKGGRLGSAVITDSKFSNSKKSIKFEEDVYFNDIFDQIDKFCRD